jgi:5-methyltetrahydropteroyltriglutamate--homocysteine methyltransferase
MTTVYRADAVGSLLRPDYLVRARAQYESGALAPAHYKEIEDRAVDQVIAMQEGAGMDVVTDGELRRHTFDARGGAGAGAGWDVRTSRSTPPTSGS